MEKFKKSMTAAELMARLQSDPEWVRQNEEREAQHKAAVAKLQEEIRPEEAPLLAELAGSGHEVNSVWDLVNTSAKYLDAIPILIKYIHLARHPVLREGIARALTIPEARGIAGQAILQELLAQKDPPGSEDRWALANALTVLADESQIDEIESLLNDASYEDVHERLNAAIKQMLRP